MTINEYIEKLGFDINPFQHANADKEVEYINEYFIKPDYFEDVWGDPLNPVSNIVYAPRGGGKTAQRIMLEKRAKNTNNVLAITYTNHDLTAFKNIDEINLTYHLTFLNRLLLIALFSRIQEHSTNYLFTFSFNERQYLYKLARIYIYDTPASFPSQAISSLKTIQDVGMDLWRNFKEPIANVISQITKSKGFEIDLSKIEIDKKLELSHKDNFLNIISLLVKTGYDSIYILVDKVDEQALTGNNPEASFNLIEDLIKDLELLETPNLCFKFFLWDSLKRFTASIARPDRVFSYDLKWSQNQILEMLNKRVSTYSKGKVTDFRTLFQDIRSLGRIVIFSELSPRDCLRICNRVISEQYKLDQNASKFSPQIVNRAIELFCEEKTREFIVNANNYKYLSKANQVSFTIEELVSNKVASDSAAVRNIINPWSTMEILKKIGLLNRKNAKAVNEYAFQDSRIAFMAIPTMDLEEFVGKKVRRCGVCKSVFYRDFDRKSYHCPECNSEVS